jgi:hypothetical protein
MKHTLNQHTKPSPGANLMFTRFIDQTKALPHRELPKPRQQPTASHSNHHSWQNTEVLHSAKLTQADRQLQQTYSLERRTFS